MKKFFALIVTAVTLLSIVAAPLAGAAPFLTDPNGLTAGTRDAQTLDEALNVEGGELTFFNGDSDNALDWSIDIDAAKSSNRDLDSSKSNVSTTVFAQAGQILEFSYRVMSQQDCDFLIFYSNGQEIARWSGIMNYYAPLEKFVFPIPSSGEYTFSWVYEKDGQYSESWDTAWLDEVRVFDMVHVESIIVDEPREIPENGKYKLKYTVLPENATEKAVTFASSDPSVAAVSEDGTVTGVSEGCAEITVTSVDGGISSAVTVTVTNDARFANLYAYIQYDPIGGNQDFIAHFTDLAPDIIEHVLDIPDCPAVRPGTSSAAVAGNYVYGYTKPGMYSGDFYIIDQEESYYERKKYFYRTIRDGENVYSLYESKLFNKNLMCIKKNNKIIVVVLQSINYETKIYNKFFCLEKNKRNISYNCKISNDENNFIIYALITIGHYDCVKYSSKFIELQDTSKWIEWFSKH